MRTVRSSLLASRTAGLTAIALALGLALAAPPTARAEVPMPRVGISVAGGGFAGTVRGWYGGLQGRLGVQWSEGFATYVMSQGLVGTIGPDRGSGAVAGALLDTLMFEATIGEMIQLGGGPGFDFIWGCSSSQHPDVCSTVGPYFSLDARAALRILAFTLSLDVHPMWLAHDAVATWATLGLGFDF